MHRGVGMHTRGSPRRVRVGAASSACRWSVSKGIHGSGGLSSPPFPECQWGWQRGSGISLLWGKVREAQVPEDVFLCSHLEHHLLLRIKQTMAVQPQTPLLPAESAKLPLKMLGGKQGVSRATAQSQVAPTAYCLPWSQSSQAGQRGTD